MLQATSEEMFVYQPKGEFAAACNGPLPALVITRGYGWGPVLGQILLVTTVTSCRSTWTVSLDTLKGFGWVWGTTAVAGVSRGGGGIMETCWGLCPAVAPHSCSAHSPSPRSGKKTPWNNATCNRGIYYWLEPGPPALTKGVRTKGPEPQFSRVFIRSKKAAGNWLKRIGYTAGSWRKRIGYTVARQFLLAQRGAFSFPLVGSLFLTRRMLIG